MSSTLPATPRAGRTRRRGTDSQSLFSALPWVGPALLLILAIVVFPAGYMIYNSTRKISSVGTDLKSVGLDNFVTIFQDPVLPRILFNTLFWVVCVVALTVVLSLALAQFLNKPFPGRTLVRMAVIVPWAASVVMTTTVFYYGLDPNYGIFNHLFVQIGLMDEGYGWTKNAVPAIAVSIIVAIFVSIPFTTYTLLAGLQAIGQETLEAARMDGAGRWKTYRLVILPQLKPALAVSVLINIINVFNNLPILKVMTGSIPGNSADTLMTYIFKVLQFDRRLDLSSALSVVNFAIVLVIVAIYIKTVKPMQEV